MPRVITSKGREFPRVKLPTYSCRSDNTRVANKPLFVFNADSQQTREEPQIVRSVNSSPVGRCNRAVQLAEKEWDPKKEYETNGENRGPDITKYRYGVDADLAWCATFFNYVYNPDHAKGKNVFGMTDRDVRSTQKILKKAKEVGCFAPAKSGYVPQVGDALIWKSDSDPNKGHIGIIVEVRDDGSFVTIQGNNNDKVEKVEYESIDDAMRRTSSSGVTQTLQGFAQMSKYYREQHDLAEAVTPENESLINPDSDYCWLT